MDFSGLQFRTAAATHLPLIRSLIDELGMMQVLDRHLPKPAQARVSDAECVVALILNILSGRLALWRMQSWLEEIDLELVLGEGADASAFNDTRLGSALDHIDEVGTDVLLSEVAVGWVSRPSHPQSYCAHLDTSSISVYGRYISVPEPVPTYGHSKDHRPDLKQLILGLSVVGPAAMPLTMSVSRGNTPEQKSNRDHLGRIAKLLPDEHEVTLVADCKLVDAKTMGQLLLQGLHVVSLVPETFTARRELVDKALSEHPDVSLWPVLARKPGRKKADPELLYRGRSYERDLAILYEDDAGQPSRETVPMRLVVVHSDQLQAKFDAALDDKLQQEVSTLTEGQTRAQKKGFACEADAKSAADELVGKLRLHTAEVELLKSETPRKRARPGRPRREEKPEVDVRYRFEIRLARDDAAIARVRHASSCFVLVSDWMSEQWSDERVLAEYRAQSKLEGITGFRWLKDVAEIAPVFLENPQRIRALGLVFVLSLMVRNYLQYTLRSAMKARGEGVRHRFSGKIDDNLTTEMALAWFSGVQSVLVVLPDGRRTRAPPQLLPQALEILELLGLSADIYTTLPA